MRDPKECTHEWSEEDVIRTGQDDHTTTIERCEHCGTTRVSTDYGKGRVSSSIIRKAGVR